MNVIEINGNLEEEKDFDIFYSYVEKTIDIFRNTFGNEIISKFDLFIDNATQSSGYTPITTVLLKKHITIKLGIDKFSNKEQIVYQFAHELCHYVFYALKGLDKERADNQEENICSAMSLIFINILFPNQINFWISHVNRLKDEKYNKGGIIAKECNLDINKLKEKIYEICDK